MPISKRPFRRLLLSLDAAFARLYGWQHNPLHQPGTIAVAMLPVLIGTGLYLILFYRVGAPDASVARIAADPWLGSWIRTLHRYASDLFVIAAVFHAIRMLVQHRSWGPRTLAWVSGLVLLGAGLVCAWTGFVMAWDTFGLRLALEGGRLIDVLPFFSEPLSRIFAGDGPVPNAFFFVNLFVHIALPLGLGIGLWLHVSRLARPTLLPPRPLMWGIFAALTIVSISLPATLGPAADPLRLATSTPTDLFVAWWLPVTERLSSGVVWMLVIVIATVAILIPRLTRRPRVSSWAVSVVDSRLCTGCNQCPQDCPWEAITMVARTDDRPTLVAQVDPSRCVSCGICAGSCAPMGVGPLGHSGRDQLANLQQETLPAWLAAGAQSPVAICCAQSPTSHLEALRHNGAFVELVPCVGNLHSSVVELMIRHGAPGVMVFGCPPRDCVGREGPKWLRERFFNEREAELQPRVDRQRVRIGTLAPGDLASALVAFAQFTDNLSKHARLGPEEDLTIETECDPVSVEEGSA